MQKEKGFTIIELVVVIVIVAVLEAVVFVSVAQYMSKSNNSAIRANMATLLTNGAAYFDKNSGSFGNSFALDVSTGCGEAGPIASEIAKAGGRLDCFGDNASQEWCGSSPTIAAGLTAAGVWCVDNTGYKGGTSNCLSGHYNCQ